MKLMILFLFIGSNKNENSKQSGIRELGINYEPALSLVEVPALSIVEVLGIT